MLFSFRRSAAALLLGLMIAHAVHAESAEADGVKTLPGFDHVRSFDVAVEGETAHLLLGRPGKGDGPGSFEYARSEDGGESWSRPVPVDVNDPPPSPHHRGNDPQIAVHGDRLMALWTGRGGGPFGSGPLVVALSEDGGKTWRSGPTLVTPPAAAEGKTGYRFPAAAADDQAFHVIWIHAVDEERGLRHARLDFGARDWTEPTTVDPRICACCWNELKVGPDGRLVALYRDKGPSDMRVAVSEDGGENWRRRGRAGRFDWRFDGCPHVGGGLAVASAGPGRPPVMFATFWTGRAGAVGAYRARSTDGGRSWTAPVELGSRGRGTHTDAAALSPTHAATIRDQTDDGGERAIFIEQTADGGATWQPPLRLSRKGRDASHPRLATCGGRFIAFWSEYAEDGPPRLRAAAVSPVMDRGGE